MKPKYLQFLLLLVLGLPSIYGKRPASCIAKVVAQCDGVRIEETSSPTVKLTRNGKEEPTALRIIGRIADREGIKKFLSSFQISDAILRKQIEVIDPSTGRTVLGIPPCQCIGDFIVDVECKGERLLRFVVFHGGEYIEVHNGMKVDQYDLVQPAGADLHAQLSEVIEKANKAVDPTTTAVTPPAEQEPRHQ